MCVKINLFSFDAFTQIAREDARVKKCPDSLADSAFYPKQPRAMDHMEIPDIPR